MVKETDCRLKRNKDLKSCKTKKLYEQKSKPKKIKQGTASLVIGLVSLSFAIFSFFSKSDPIQGEALSLFGREGLIFAVPLTLIFIVISTIAWMFYFRSKK